MVVQLSACADQRLSQVFCGGESIAVSMAVANGYGYHFATIDRAQFDAVMKVCKVSPQINEYLLTVD